MSEWIWENEGGQIAQGESSFPPSFVAAQQTTNIEVNWAPSEDDVADPTQEVYEEQVKPEPPVEGEGWDVMNDDRVSSIVAQAATKAANVYKTYMTAEDLAQEGAIWVSQNSDFVKSAMADSSFGGRALFGRVYSRLADVVRYEAKKASQTHSITNPDQMGDGDE